MQNALWQTIGQQRQVGDAQPSRQFWQFFLLCRLSLVLPGTAGQRLLRVPIEAPAKLASRARQFAGTSVWIGECTVADCQACGPQGFVLAHIVYPPEQCFPQSLLDNLGPLQVGSWQHKIVRM